MSAEMSMIGKDNGLLPIRQWAISSAPASSGLGNIPYMESDWREHMMEAVKKDGRDMKALSRAMGQGETFVRDMLKRGRKPNIEAVIALADVLGLTVSELVEGEPVMRSR